jgi:hypothetical protein
VADSLIDRPIKLMLMDIPQLFPCRESWQDPWQNPSR